MPKLLIATTVSQMADAFLLPYARHYRAKGWTVDCAASKVSESRECAAAFDRVWDVGWSRNPFDLSAVCRSARTMQRLWRRERYDLVHVHSPIAAFVTRVALRRQQRAGQVRVVYTAHGFHFHKNGTRLKNLVFRSLEEFSGRWTDCLIVINQEDLAAAQKLRSVPAESVRFMPGIGVDLKIHDIDPSQAISVAEEWRARGIRCGEDFVFLVAAEIAPRKRHADILQALAQLPARCHLVVAGSGPSQESTKQLAVRLGIERRVHFVGQRKDIPAVIQASNALLLISEREGLPRCIMEAFALGKPVIASDIRGNRDLLQDGRGLLVPLGDIRKIAAAMQHVVQYPETAKQMTESSQKYVERLGIDILLARHDELYSELLGKSVPRSSPITRTATAAAGVRSQANWRDLHEADL